MCRECASFLDDAKSRRSEFYPERDKRPRKDERVPSREKRRRFGAVPGRGRRYCKASWRPTSTVFIRRRVGETSHGHEAQTLLSLSVLLQNLVYFLQGAAARRVAVTWCRRRRRSAVLGTGGRLQLPTIYFCATRRPCR